MNLSLKASACLAFTLFIGSALSAQSLTTTFAGGNGGGTGWGNFFELTNTSGKALQITKLDVNASSSPSTKFTIDVYITSKTFVGKDGTPAVWTKVATGSGVSKGRNNKTPVDITDFVLSPGGSYGIAVYFNGTGMAYTNGTGGSGSLTTFKNSDLTLKAGVSRAGRFSGSKFDPRIWNGTIYYSKAATAFYGTFGAGCKGTSGTPVIAALSGSLPKLGSLFKVSINGMPTVSRLALMMTSVSNNSFNGAPLLPLDLKVAGAPGCFLLVDPLLFTAVPLLKGKGTLALPIPNLPALKGIGFFQQGIGFEKAANAAGFVVSNGGMGIFGT
jgi:hypothetical protein